MYVHAGDDVGASYVRYDLYCTCLLSILPCQYQASLWGAYLWSWFAALAFPMHPPLCDMRRDGEVLGLNLNPLPTDFFGAILYMPRVS